MSIDSPRLNLGLSSLERSSLDILPALEQQRPDAAEVLGADGPAAGGEPPPVESTNVLAALAWGSNGSRMLDTSAYQPSGNDPVQDLDLVDALVSGLS